MPSSLSAVALSVSLNPIAAIRQARKGTEPSPVELARVAETGGAAGVTAHLREDDRHIQVDDLEALRAVSRGKFTLEIGGTWSMLELAEKCRPDQVTLVPERADETTQAGGLDLVRHQRRVQRAANTLAAADIQVAVFVDPQSEQVDCASQLANVRAIELNAAGYARQQPDSEAARESLEALQSAAAQGRSNDLAVLAGHGLDYQSVGAVAALPTIEELCIGHAIVARALEVGFHTAVEEMVLAMRAR